MNSENNTINGELVIGITGHRWVRESQRLLDAIDKVFKKVAKSHSPNSLKLISPLAEGADRIVARRILSLPNAHIFALLPFPIEEYLEDFSTPESVREFCELLHLAEHVIELPGKQVREDAYMALGRSLLDQCEVMVAIWDGKPARGSGGTAEIVLGARERGMPLAWILHKQPGSVGHDLISTEEAQMRIVFERFPVQKSTSESDS